MKYSLPPFNEREKRGYIEEKILCFSKELFRKRNFGILYAIIFNLFYFFMCSLTKSVISLLFYFCFIYFALRTFFFPKKNK